MPEPAPTRPPPPSDFAVASLILGIVSLITCAFGPLFAIPAIICGYIARRRVLAQPARYSGRGLALAGQITGIIGIALWCGVVPFVFRAFPAISTPWEMARRINCASDLKAIGFVCMMYASDYEGSLPPDFETLWHSSYLNSGKIYVCPSTATSPATDAAGLATHFDYLYFGAGLNRETMKNQNRTVLMADKTGNHTRYWNVVMMDGQLLELTDPHNLGFRAAARQRGWIIPGAADRP